MSEDLENTARLPAYPQVVDALLAAPITHLSPQQQRVFATLAGAAKLIDAMMPGVRHIALQDYAALNEVPLAIAKLLRELADPKTTEEVAQYFGGVRI
jgi:hypothetical protein